MISRLAVLVVTLLLTSLLLGACTLPTSGPFETSGYTATVDEPMSGAVYGLGTQIHLIGYVDYTASQPAATSLTFWANGTQLGGAISDLEVDTEGADVTADARHDWTPPAPGQYQIQVQASISGNHQSISNPVQICVLDFAFPTANIGYDSGAWGYTGPCPLPAAPSLIVGTGTVTFSGQASPANLVVDDYVNGTRVCTASTAPIITFQASADDLGGRIALVIADIDDLDSSGSGGGDSIVLHQSSALGLPARTFTGSYDDTGLLGNLVDSSGTSIPGEVVWRMHAYGRDGALLASVGPNSIPVVPCAPGAAGPLPPPPPAPPAVTATDTPASALDCPSGTYFADVTHQCIAIATPTTSNGGPAVCSKITSSSVCNSTPGCHFNITAKACQKK